MTRSEELDKMSEEDKQKDILENIKKHGAIRLENRDQIKFWGDAIDALQNENKIIVKSKEDYEGQYSYYLITESKGKK